MSLVLCSVLGCWPLVLSLVLGFCSPVLAVQCACLCLVLLSLSEECFGSGVIYCGLGCLAVDKSGDMVSLALDYVYAGV